MIANIPTDYTFTTTMMAYSIPYAVAHATTRTKYWEVWDKEGREIQDDPTAAKYCLFYLGSLWKNSNL